MNDDCSGWLSKAHPPKFMLKPSLAVRQRGPLSSSTPPRRFGNQRALDSLYASYLTQNSPPPPQLITARKQSSLTDFFGVKDRGNPAVNKTCLKGKEKAPLVTRSIQEYSFKEPCQVPGVETAKDSVYKNSESATYLGNEHWTCESGLRQSKNVGNSVDISVSICGDSNKENSWQACKIQQDSFCVLSEEELDQEWENIEILNEKSSYYAKWDTKEFVTFSEGLKFLSQESQIIDNSETFPKDQYDNSLVDRFGNKDDSANNGLDSDIICSFMKAEPEKDCDSLSPQSNISKVMTCSTCVPLQGFIDGDKNIQDSYSNHNSVDSFYPQTSHDAAVVSGSSSQRFNQSHHSTDQDTTTLNFTSEFCHASDVDFGNADSSIFENNEFQRKKEMYVLEMGSFMLSELL